MALAIDQTPALVHAVASAVTTTTFTTTTASEIVIAICTADGFFSGTGNHFTITSNAGLSWTLIERQNVKSASCEAWYAITSSTLTSATVTATNSGGNGDAISLQVITLSGQYTSPIGAVGSLSPNAAAISSSLTTTGDNSYVFSGYSNSATAPDSGSYTAGTSQTLIGSFNGTATHGGGAHWRQTSTTATNGTSVTMNLTAPSTSTGDMILFEILSQAPVTPPLAPSVSDSSTVTNVVTQLLLIDNLSVFDSSAVTESVTVRVVDGINTNDSSAVTENTTINTAVVYPIQELANQEIIGVRLIG